MESVILFRKDRDTASEMEIARNHFTVVENRTDPRIYGSLVIPRYSSLPFYDELENDVKLSGSRLINSHRQHRWIADFKYYEQLKPFTFRSWTESEYARSDYDGPVVCKGKTNSLKHHWSKSMFAQEKGQALEIAQRLREDTFIGQQGIVFREYVKLRTFEIGLFGLPFTNEFRLFFYKNRRLASGFYWVNMVEPEVAAKAELTDEGLKFAQQVAEVASQHANFFVLDIAEKEAGGWVLIEVNCGTMSGLSDCDAGELYADLAYWLDADPLN